MMRSAVISCMLGVLLIASAPAGFAVPAAERRPNLLVILADDLGYSDLGCYGGEIRTPHLDRLAASGVRFRNFHNAARCSPTRMSLLSGLHPQQVMTDPAAGTPPARPDGNIFLPEILASAGYRTAMAGKWHLGAQENQTPWRRGFGHVFAPADIGSGTIDYWRAAAWKLWSPGDITPPAPGTSGFYSTDAIGDHAVAFLESHLRRADEAPFFLYVPFNAPHFHLSAPRDVVESAPAGGRAYVDTYAAGWDSIRAERHRRMLAIEALPRDCPLPPPSDVVDDAQPGKSSRVPAWDALPADRRADLARRMAVYAASVERLDDAVGRIVRRLEDAGILDDTVVVFLSDNGGCAEGGMFGWTRTAQGGPRAEHDAPLAAAKLISMGGPATGHQISLGGGWADACNTPFRFYKQQTHEGGIRTPLIVRWPRSRIAGGHWIDQNGHVIDILPTLLAATGCEYPATHRGHALSRLEGMDLLAACRGGPSTPRKLGYEHMGNRAWVDGDWKLVTKNFASADGSSPADAVELYDLASDPTESHDVAAREPERVRAMAAAWNAWATRVGVSPGRLFPERQFGRSQAPASAAGPEPVGLVAQVTRPVHPILVGNEHGPLLRVAIEAGPGRQVHVSALRFSLAGTDALADIDSLRVFSTGTSQTFSPRSPIGDPVPPTMDIEVPLDLDLAEGRNIFWLSCRLKDSADLDHRIRASCTSIVTSVGTSIVTSVGTVTPRDDDDASRQRLGVALRRGGDDGVHTYRIPSLTTSAAGTLLAVYDMRHRAERDLQEDIDIGLSRSVDGGRTWDKPRVIMDMGRFGGLPQEQNGCSDPGIVVDRTTGEIFCFAVWMNGKPGKHQWVDDGSEPGFDVGRSAQFMVVRSRDDGRTWSQPENLTRKLKRESWWLLAPSPQSGLCLADGTLVMPVEGRFGGGKLDSFATLMVSRDHGETWTVGEPAYSGGNECQAAELSDGSIMLNIRNDRERFRAVAVTEDLGRTWRSHPTSRTTLIEPNCNGSLLRCDLAHDGRRRHVLLFANPHSQTARTHHTVQVSFDDGRSWPASHHVLLDEGRGAGYPSLTRIDDSHVGIVYEGSQAQLVFQRLPLAELLEPGER